MTIVRIHRWMSRDSASEGSGAEGLNSLNSFLS